MKLVKLLRPLFFVALGLHGLALFLPLGGASEVVEEEPVEETVETVAAAEEPLAAPGQLPVPDLNVATDGTATAPTPVPASATASVLSPTAVRQPTPVAQPNAARSAPLAMAVPNAGASRTTPVGMSESGSPSLGLSNVQSEESTAAATTDEMAASSSPPLELPESLGGEATEIEEQESSNTASNRTVPTDGSQSSSSSISIESVSTEEGGDRSLIASALSQLPDSLKALVNRWAIALNYNPKGTDDSSAKAARDRWTTSINSQASRNSIGRLEPDYIEDFARLSYPIESSVKDNEQSFRVCLEQPPSPAEVGVLFDSQGQIVGDPKLVRSSGYKAVNDEVMALVKSAQVLPDKRFSKAFVLQIPIDYDEQACVQLSDVKK